MATRGHNWARAVRDRCVLGNFSVDENGHYCNDDRNRKFFVRPNDEPDFDLTEGMDSFVPYDEHGPRMLENLLLWIKDHRDVLKERELLLKIPGTRHWKLGVDFVSRRGMLGRFLLAAYSPERSDLFVTLYRGTFYLLKSFDIDGEGAPQNILDPQDRTFEYVGCKFKQLVTSGDGYQPDTFLPINALDTYYAMMKATIGDKTFLFSSEVQAENQDTEAPPPENYMAIKTWTRTGYPLSWYKRMHWWTQCHLTGIQDIVCGRRDIQTQRIASMEYYKMDELVENAKGVMTPDNCLKKLESLLQDIKDKVTDDDPRSVYHLVLEEITEQGQEKYKKLETRKFVLKGKREEDFVLINDWFIEDVLGGE